MFKLNAVNNLESEAPAPGLEKAITVAGGLSELARLLDVDPQLIVHWRKRGVPPLRVIPIEQALQSAVTRYELRPDIYGEAPAVDAQAVSEAG